ncbi:ribosomal protein L34e superfamily protein [Artemisia annua]|uniref:Ribosomal protein L34e superfamily protein n=1 Tax=Artemisia annua TaxID=35608 RepID=A0A2U1MZ57_ARTAN|nr:ribosomal protein L34e superfamily protein [Artemisia annua]
MYIKIGLLVYAARLRIVLEIFMIIRLCVPLCTYGKYVHDEDLVCCFLVFCIAAKGCCSHGCLWPWMYGFSNFPAIVLESSDSCWIVVYGDGLGYSHWSQFVPMIQNKRKCGKKGCKGLKKALEFDLQLQSEEMLRGGGKGVREVEELPWKGGSEGNADYECFTKKSKTKHSLLIPPPRFSEEMLRGGGKGVREVEELPWKGGSEGNADYECLRSELRKMAPVNGRAVLLFRLKCGCAVAKLEGWGPKRGRRNKK